MTLGARFRIWKLLTILAAAVLITAFLTGCQFAPPYPEYVLDKADPWINSITYLPDAELQDACSGAARVMGCADLISGEIFVTDDPAVRECTLRHERSHFYEVYVAGIGVVDTQEHKRWTRVSCPAGVRKISPVGRLSIVAQP